MCIRDRVEEGDGFEENQDEYTAENIFFVPENARWSAIAAAAHTPEIGTVIDDAMRSIETVSYTHLSCPAGCAALLFSVRNPADGASAPPGSIPVFCPSRASLPRCGYGAIFEYDIIPRCDAQYKKAAE